MLEYGKVYRFCVDGTSNALNLYYSSSSSTANGTKINVMKQDGSKEQLWHYNGDRLYTEHARNSKCLHRNSNQNTAVIYSKSSSYGEDQYLEFVYVNSGEYAGDKVKIKLEASSSYLIAGTSQCT